MIINRCKLDYFKANGATSSQYNQAEREYLKAVTTGFDSVGDMWKQLLGGNVTDGKLAFWHGKGCPHGGTTPPPSGSDAVVLSASINNDDKKLIVIEYDKAVQVPPSPNLLDMLSVIVMINGVRAPADELTTTFPIQTGVQIILRNEASAGDVITYKYEHTIDPRFTEEAPPHLVIDNAVYPVINLISPAPEPPPPLDLVIIAEYMMSDGWTAREESDTVIITIGSNETSYSRALLESCDLSSIHPTPLHNDFCDALDAQLWCIGTCL